jgi:hypothetical protein
LLEATTSSTLEQTVASMTAGVTRMLDQFASLQESLSFVARLRAFFGPMLVGKEPPLNGDDIATRAYVDAAVSRLSSALSGKIAEAKPEGIAAIVNRVARLVAKPGRGRGRGR